MSDETAPTLPLTGDGSDGEHAGATYGRFQSLGVIGRGGMGVVLRARDPELGRDVAIKVLAPSGAAPRDRVASERLQREAQAMARLSHPNVVTVYEIGQVGDQRFIAMELVEGATLRRWLAERPRPWRAIVTAFVACGRGLAAAHSAGLVHRDFKPDNVLIGADGRPRVTDFGLVTATEPVGEADAAAAPASAELSVRGALVGTPMYMAPEQWRGIEVDARADQFAFCVSLWEALHGARPFAGTTSVEIRASVLDGKVASVPRGARSHRRIDALLRRGLDRGLDARWPSMEPLLDALEGTLRRRWPWVAGALAIGGAIAATALLMRPAAVDPCPDPAPRLAGVWDAATRDRVVARFAAIHPTLGPELAERIVPALDRHAARWTATSLASCRATRVDGSQSPAMLDTRALCLDRRRDELRALTAAIATADLDRMTGAVDDVYRLGDLEQCDQPESFLAFPLPTDPALRQRITELEQELTAISALRFGEDPVERQRRATAAVATARALGHPPALVRALHEQVGAAIDNEDDVATEAALRELGPAAAEARDDFHAATSWIKLIQVLSRSGKTSDARPLEPVATSAVVRAGDLPLQRWDLEVALATRQIRDQEFDAGIERLERLLATAGPALQRAAAQLNLARAYGASKKHKAGLRVAEAALPTVIEVYGPTHPSTADAHHLIAQLRSETGDIAGAQASADQALAVQERVFGPDHLRVAKSLLTVGHLARKRDAPAAARRAYERAIAIMDRAPDPNGAARARGALADLIARSDGIDAARPVFLAALDGLGKAIGTDKHDYLHLASSFANQLIAAGKCDEARPWLAHAIAGYETLRPNAIPVLRELEAKCK